MELKILLKELAKYGVPESEVLKLIKPKTPKFKAIVRYNRGLGPEFTNLNIIEAENLTEANRLAVEEAELFFKTKEGFEKAVIIEIRLQHVKE
jgi:hypothetical protein